MYSLPKDPGSIKEVGGNEDRRLLQLVWILPNSIRGPGPTGDYEINWILKLNASEGPLFLNVWNPYLMGSRPIWTRVLARTAWACIGLWSPTYRGTSKENMGDVSGTGYDCLHRAKWEPGIARIMEVLLLAWIVLVD